LKTIQILMNVLLDRHKRLSLNIIDNKLNLNKDSLLYNHVLLEIEFIHSLVSLAIQNEASINNFLITKEKEVIS